MRAAWSRRQFAGGLGAAFGALAVGRPALGQGLGQQFEGLLGKIPQPLQALLPAEAFEAAGFVRAILALEGEAKALRLPSSILARSEGDIPLDPERLYAIAMPRLVALIDRSEQRSPAFADKAGALLARLHATQHSVPAAFSHLSAQPGRPLLQPLAFGGQEQPPPLPLPGPAPEPLPAPSDPPADAAAPLPEPGSLLRTYRYEALADEYRQLFAAATIRPERRDEADWHLTMMRQARPRYAAIAARAGVPWQFIAAIHGMEASFNFRAHFHNGDFPLQQRTRQVPAGRPLKWLPPSDWESSALDALRLLGFTNQDDWSLPRTLHRLEAFNGFGYRRLGRVSPYLWSFTTLFERGKFVADGRFDPRARSLQCGTAAMLKVLADAGELDLTA